MKRFLTIILAILTIFCFCACDTKSERADELSLAFIRALALRDEAEMEKYLHPDYIDKAMPNDEFYKNLEEQFFTAGNPLDGLDAISKGKAEGIDFDGDAMKCTYVARINELFYTVELIILDNDSGYGIVSIAVVLNTDTKYYKNENA